MKLTIRPSDHPVENLALVTTEHMQALCDGAAIGKESGNLKLTYDNLTRVHIKIGDASVASDAMGAIRRAINNGESSELEIVS